MKKLFAGLSFFIFFSITTYSQQASEEEVKARIQQARTEADAAQTAVRNASQIVQEKGQQIELLRGGWNKKQEEIKAIRQKISSVDNTLAKSVEHIDTEIKRCENRLATLKRNNADEGVIDQAQRELTAYQNMKANRLRNSRLTALKATYIQQGNQREAELAALKPQLQNAIDEAKYAEEQLNDLQLKSADAQLKLADILQKAPELLNNINPPYLKNVSVRGSNNGNYEAGWDDLTKRIDEQIQAVIKGIREQKKVVQAYKDVVEECSNQLLEQQHIADAKLDAYVEEVQSWSWVKASLADMIDAGINIARNFKEMGPYAFAYEAVYRTGEALFTNTTNSNWDINKLPDQPNAPVDVTGIAGNMGIAVGKDQIKALINQALQTYIGTNAWGLPGESIRYATEASLKGADVGFRKLINEGKFWVVADKGLNSKWMLTLTEPHGPMGKLEEIFATLKRSPKAFLENFKSSFNKERLKGALLDFAQSTAIQALKEWLDQKRLNLWSDYLVEDMKRTEMLNNLKLFGALRQWQTVILDALNEVLQQLIKNKEEQATKPTRYLQIKENQVVSGSSCTISLEFSADIQIDSVVLAGRKVNGSGNKNVWTGTVDLSGINIPLAQLSVTAKGSITQKILDDPYTATLFAATTQSWAGYEPSTDTYHKISLKGYYVGTSIVLLIDCSGSMNDNGRIQRAIKAAQNVLSSHQFGPYDEIAIMTFQGCGGAKLLQAFTDDYNLLREKVRTLSASGGTPLAESMKQASQYLETSARNKYRKLIVLTDGEESCGGNEFEALRMINELHQVVAKYKQ